MTDQSVEFYNLIVGDLTLSTNFAQTSVSSLHNIANVKKTVNDTRVVTHFTEDGCPNQTHTLQLLFSTIVTSV